MALLKIMNNWAVISLLCWIIDTAFFVSLLVHRYAKHIKSMSAETTYASDTRPSSQGLEILGNGDEKKEKKHDDTLFIWKSREA